MKLGRWLALFAALTLSLSSLPAPTRSASAAEQPVATADYQFQNSLATSAGTAGDLENLGEGNGFLAESVDGGEHTVLAFPEGNGLILNSTVDVIPNDSYTVVVLFRIESVESWRMIADFKNTVGDNALYTYGHNLNFYPTVYGTGAPFQQNQWVQVALTRDGASGNTVGYVDGSQAIQFDDAADSLAVISTDDVLRFFQDDAGVGSEHSAGQVARIRLFDHPLSAEEVAGLDRLP